MHGAIELAAAVGVALPTGRPLAAIIVGVLGVLAIVAILGIGTDSPDYDLALRSPWAWFVFFVTGLAVVCILFLEVVRVFLGISVGLSVLLATLAAWQVARDRPRWGWLSRLWRVWLGVAITLSVLYVLLMLVPFQPQPWQHWLWLAAPYVVPVLVSSAIGAIYRHYRRRSLALDAAARQQMLTYLGGLMRAKLDRDSAAAAVDAARTERRKQAWEREQSRLSSLRAQNAEWSARALAIGEGQWRALPPAGPDGDRRFALRMEVLHALYDATAGHHEQGIVLPLLAEECGLTVELTYFFTTGLAHHGYVWEEANPTRELSSQVGVGITLKGIHRLEDFVNKKPNIDLKNGVYVGGNVGDGAQVSNVGRDQKGNVSNRTSALDDALPEVLRAARDVQSLVSDPAQKEFIEEQLRVVEQGSIDKKRSALSALKAFSQGLGNVAKPLLDTLNGISDLFS